MPCGHVSSGTKGWSSASRDIENVHVLEESDGVYLYPKPCVCPQEKSNSNPPTPIFPEPSAHLKVTQQWHTRTQSHPTPITSPPQHIPRADQLPATNCLRRGAYPWQDSRGAPKFENRSRCGFVFRGHRRVTRYVYRSICIKAAPKITDLS